MPTKIEWAQESWNPITGCSKISEGCQNCYAERMSHRLAGRFGYPKMPNQFKLTLHQDKLMQPLVWKKPRRIFVCSMGDLFHHNVYISWLNYVFNIIHSAWSKNLGHKFLILTKRPTRMKRYIEAHRNYESAVCYYETSNVWLGVTAENQKRADERIPVLLQIPAVVHFVSIEPMLGPIDVESWGWRNTNTTDPRINWVICGAETGPKRRVMNLEWPRSIYAQCYEAGVPFFFKKDTWGNHTLDGKIWEEFPK